MAEINATQMRDALAWATGDKEKATEPSSNWFVWFWEAIEGDFNEERSTAQILTDAGISMIPLIDQVCDIRDLCANCRKISRAPKDVWAWVALVLTLIGLFPTIGSLAKGILKIFFAFVRRAGIDQIVKGVDAAMSSVIGFLRRKRVQEYLKAQKVDRVFKWLATGIRAIRRKVSAKTLTAAFDRGIATLQAMANKVAYLPTIGEKAKQTLLMVKKVRLWADDMIAPALQPVHRIMDAIIERLEREAAGSHGGAVNVANVHYRGPLPEAAAVTLMAKKKPNWLSKTGDPFFKEASLNRYRKYVDKSSASIDPKTGKRRAHTDIFPPLSDQSIKSFHTLTRHVVIGPAKLYRILAPNSRAMSDCWVSEAVFKQLQDSPDPKAAWRKYLAVWPDWNVNGQFVVYELKAGETLNTWRGVASSQKKKNLPGQHLEGGWEQIVFNVARLDRRTDAMLFYPLKGARPGKPGAPITAAQFYLAKSKIPSAADQKAFEDSFISFRENINHPNIKGPFSTGWGYTEFDGVGTAGKIGLPALPGQATKP